MTEVIQIDKSTWRIEDQYVRFFLVEGNDQAVLIDSGISTPNAREVAAKLTDKPIMLVNTHGDGDHVSGTGAFDKIYMSSDDYYNCGLDKRFPATSLSRLRDKDIIELGERKLEIIEIPGHTKGSIAILDIQKRRLFSGDTVQSGHIFMFGGHRSPALFEESLNKLIAFQDRYDVILPSHDRPELPSDYSEKVLESWREVMSGRVSSTDVELHGVMVKSYDAEHCGFFCE